MHYRLLLSKPPFVIASFMSANAAFPGQSWVIMRYFLGVQYTDVQKFFSSLQVNGDKE